MTEPEIYTQQWLKAKLEREAVEKEKAEQAKTEEDDREAIVQAWKAEHGVEPTIREVEAALAEKRQQDVVARAQANQAQASRAIRMNF